MIVPCDGCGTRGLLLAPLRGLRDGHRVLGWFCWLCRSRMALRSKEVRGG